MRDGWMDGRTGQVYKVYSNSEIVTYLGELNIASFEGDHSLH